MITKMKKYTFLVFHKEYDAFLSMLQEAGVVHVSEKAEGVADDPKLQELILKQKELQHLLDQGAPDQLLLERAEVIKKIDETAREAADKAVWGEFSAEKIEALRKAGYELSFFACQKSKFQAEWGTPVAEVSGKTYFVAINTEEEFEGAERINLEKSAADLRKDVENLNGLLAVADARIDAWKLANLSNLQQQLAEAEQQIDWQRVVLNTEKAAENALCLLEGYCPEDKAEALNQKLDADHIYYQAVDPVPGDDAPIKLHNNKLTRIFECLTGMYGWPTYGEFDPTPILAPFYLLFFALCMGDMGYGIILIIYGLLQSKKIVNISMFDGLGPIITVLGIATTVVGFFMNTVFGVSVTMLDWHPAKVAGYDFWMVAAIVIGIFHICLAMTVKAICSTVRFGFRETVSTWGWLLLIVGTIATLLLSMALSLPTAVVEWTMIVIGAISALGIFVFNTPGRNPLINVGAGLWDTYNMATGLLGDVLSYIRLYALGLAGGMLGGAFNNLAVNMVWGGGEGSIGALIGKGAGMVLILLLGHILNLLMACLGAFVHPLRLTFVEYFKNAGYEGKGSLYKPFSKN